MQTVGFAYDGAARQAKPGHPPDSPARTPHTPPPQQPRTPPPVTTGHLGRQALQASDPPGPDQERPTPTTDTSPCPMFNSTPTLIRDKVWSYVLGRSNVGRSRGHA